MQLLVIAIAIVAALVLIKIWTGAMNVGALESQSLAAVEQKHPYLPKIGAIVISVAIAAGLFLLSLKFGKTTSLGSILSSSGMIRMGIVFGAVILFGTFDQRRWHGLKDRYQYFYGMILGTLASWILVAFKRSFFEFGIGQDPFLMALGFACVVIGWRFMFGPWKESVKATVLGTFIFWIAFAILRHETRQELLATSIAAVAAIIPVVIWCKLFLSYHKERIGVVLVAFFAGMLSTVPILFWHELMSRGIQLNFFLFKVIPVSFNTSSSQFISQSVLDGGAGTVQSIVLTTLVTYLIVGIIEEISKYWVLRHSSQKFFQSIDDTMQLAIVVAIGFAFAENLANPTYFVGFVQNYLLKPESPQWAAFIAGVFGRGVLTMMVHILSTGILGYFFGLAYFAGPSLREKQPNIVVRIIGELLSFRQDTVYAQLQMIVGMVAAIVTHGLFDFIVSLPEVLPGRPATVGALLGSPATSPLNSLSIVMIPSLLYVVGGFWLLVTLFQRKEDMKVYGTLTPTTAIVN